MSLFLHQGSRKLADLPWTWEVGHAPELAHIVCRQRVLTIADCDKPNHKQEHPSEAPEFSTPFAKFGRVRGVLRRYWQVLVLA